MTGSRELGFLSGAGERANAIVPLTWFMLIVSVLVCAIVGGLLLSAILRNRGRAEAGAHMPTVERVGDGMRWIKWGLAVSAVPLLASIGWTMAVLGRTVGPPTGTTTTIDVRPRQWWWEVDYGDPSRAGGFATANEIHIPVGVRTMIRLGGGDVIHSFWVPQLSGKTDAIPGQTNVAWLEADKPGRYRGQCAEYCGLEHARMAFDIVADSPADFASWRARQLAPVARPVAADAAAGFAIFQAKCAACHALRGTGLAADRAPDLSHLMTRREIAAGVLPNTRGSLAGWIEDPQSAKPGARMPGQRLSGRELTDVLAFLETLR